LSLDQKLWVIGQVRFASESLSPGERFLGATCPPRTKNRWPMLIQMLQYNEDGRVAQLGEHLLCKQGVAGSNPVTSTNLFSDCKTLTEFISSPTPRFSCTG